MSSEKYGVQEVECSSSQEGSDTAHLGEQGGPETRPPLELTPAQEIKLYRKVDVRLAWKDAYELDGDVEGEGTLLQAEVDPGSLRIKARPTHRTGAPAANPS